MSTAELVGLIPAAGRARRLAGLPLSKELLPVGVREAPPAGTGGASVRIGCDSLLEALAVAKAARAYVVLRDEKLDLARYLGAGEAFGVPLAHLCLRDSASLPESLDRAHPFVAGSRVALGFPDVQLGPVDAIARVADRQSETGADLVLGLFPTERPQTTDMVDVDDGGRVRRLEVRPARTALRLCWVVAVWGPAFGEHLHRTVAAAPKGGAELQIGEVVAGAVSGGLDVRAVEIPGGWFRDVGSPADLAAAWRR